MSRKRVRPVEETIMENHKNGDTASCSREDSPVFAVSFFFYSFITLLTMYK
jgi:hypothetical protein